jgi:hypothetical protein
VTLIAAAIILTFTTLEFIDYRRVTIDTSIVVDRSRGQKLTMYMNVTFPRVPCYRECSRSFPYTIFFVFVLIGDGYYHTCYIRSPFPILTTR